jgi:CheY-like chemotaxis protein
MVEFLQRTLGETVDVEAVGAAGLWEIEVDLPQLEAAMINLAINARDAMPDGGKLTIEALNTYLDQDYCHQHPEVTPGQYVLICVTDTGLGMEQDVIARAFEPFFTTKEVGHGTGLGLSQVYGFVKQSHGHIRIYSEPSQGTTIKVYLPRRRHADHETSSDDVDSEETLAGGERGECILVVEDDIDVRNYVVQTLRELNYRVTGVANAHAALSVLRSEDRVDLMLTDVVMRGLNGRELAEQAKNLRPGMPILFMTGYSRNAIIHQGRIDNGIDLLQKPISQAQLSNRIRELLDKSANSTF